MNEAVAHERLAGVLELIDRMGATYERRWGHGGQPEQSGLDSQLKGLIDEVRRRTTFAHDLIEAMGERSLAARVEEHEEGLYGGHPFTQARIAIVQAIAGPGVSGENLAILFSINVPTTGSPRLRLRAVDPASKTWKSAHEGASALVRGAFMGVRNLVSHPGWPDPSPQQALDMLAILSYVANLVDQSDVAESQ